MCTLLHFTLSTLAGPIVTEIFKSKYEIEILFLQQHHIYAYLYKLLSYSIIMYYLYDIKLYTLVHIKSLQPYDFEAHEYKQLYNIYSYKCIILVFNILLKHILHYYTTLFP